MVFPNFKKQADRDFILAGTNFYKLFPRTPNELHVFTFMRKQRGGSACIWNIT